MEELRLSARFGEPLRENVGSGGRSRWSDELVASSPPKLDKPLCEGLRLKLG